MAIEHFINLLMARSQEVSQNVYCFFSSLLPSPPASLLYLLSSLSFIFLFSPFIFLLSILTLLYISVPLKLVKVDKFLKFTQDTHLKEIGA